MIFNSFDPAKSPDDCARVFYFGAAGTNFLQKLIFNEPRNLPGFFIN
jgi:hypothetical protein